MIEAIKIRVNLDESDPLIWRELLVAKDISFYILHHTIQIAMGWTNSHLFEFKLEGYRVGVIYDKLDGLDEGEIIDAKNTKLTDLVTIENEAFIYEYDFGDSWNHIIIVEKHVMLEDGHQLPFCTAGELKCPPEDCGGIPGYNYILNILADKKHEEYKDIKAWIGAKFNATDFDVVKTNKKLKTIGKLR